MKKDNFENDLKDMLDNQIVKRGISDERLIHAIQAVPRHLFVPDDYKPQAYNDGPLPIGFGQTISQPYIVALMVSELHLKGLEHVLEIGTGCGYQAAILSHLAADVITLEIIPDLAERATQTLNHLGIKNVSVVTGDGSMGWVNGAPYNAILISAATPGVPPPLLEQLAEGGRLILPVGSHGFQRLEIWSYCDSIFRVETSIPVSFVPLRGKHGWKI
ncbi:MAG: protein-L-isoaspartate O-methyltransferase [Chloroflexi bacterium GWB2_49_20]|nr:MAG: protein-L-isoaspartate O-methyltransferase [Chloroflexi bacterium GWB2_49_20]OGN79020.1 MAG: protein-L-isoaspartate O-methyltransferase [Chloroflexi bacterium GWC2_49_37]OGN86220.1 MAG: protein-L-isoaspartate O-methyltransferase [Chloroflexi bacterium GWD2_49_16]